MPLIYVAPASPLKKWQSNEKVKPTNFYGDSQTEAPWKKISTF